MKILFIADKWSNGGVPTVMKTLTRSLLERGIQVHWLFYYKGPVSNPFNDVAKFQVHALGAKRSGDISIVRPFYQLLNNIEPDIIHDHFGGLWSSLVLFSKWRNRAILHYHNEFEVESSSPDDRRTIKETFFKRILLKRYPKIVSVSQHNARTIKKYNPQGNVEAIPNGIDLNVQNSNSRGEKTEKLRIGFLGRLVHEKGVDTLLRSIVNIPQNQVECFIAGDGDPMYINNLEAIKSNNNLNNVHFLGRIDDLESYFKQIDVSYFGSRQEPFGLTILESWLNNKPIIGFYPENGGGPYELLPENDSIGGKLLVKRNEDQLEKLIQDIIENRDIIEKWKSKLDEKLSLYNQESITEKWLKVYKEVNPLLRNVEP